MKKILLILLCVPLMFSCTESATESAQQKNSAILSDILSDTESAQLKNSAILGDILSDEEVRKKAFYQQKIEKADDMGLDYKSLERQINQFYTDYIAKHGETDRGTMSKNMRNKESEYYNREFDHVQGIVSNITFSVTRNPSDTIPPMNK